MSDQKRKAGIGVRGPGRRTTGGCLRRRWRDWWRMVRMIRSQYSDPFADLDRMATADRLFESDPLYLMAMHAISERSRRPRTDYDLHVRFFTRHNRLPLGAYFDDEAFN